MSASPEAISVTSYVGTNRQSCQLCPPARFRTAGHDVTGRRNHGVARWRGGKKEVTMTCFAHVLYTHKLAIGTSQKFGIILYYQFAYHGGNFVEKHSLLYFRHFFPWCNVIRASLARFRAAGYDVTGRRSRGVARWRGGKKEGVRFAISGGTPRI